MSKYMSKPKENKYLYKKLTRFLKENGAYFYYIYNLRRRADAWDELSLNLKFSEENVIQYAFDWKKSEMPRHLPTNADRFKYWSDLNDKYLATFDASDDSYSKGKILVPSTIDGWLSSKEL